MKKIIFILSLILISTGMWGADSWVKVTSAPVDWSGEYLLVYETSSTAGVAWTGVDATNCGASVTISSGTITTKPASAVSITVSTMAGGYSIRVNGGTNNGKYIKGTSGSNTLGFDNSAQLNTITYESSSVKINSNTSVLRYNSASNQLRFRYFKSSSYTAQQIIQLYKKTSSITTYTVIYNANGGSSVVDEDSPYESGSSVTVKQGGTKNGCTFDSWNTKLDGSGSEFFEGETFTITKDTTFYAQWLKDTLSKCNVFFEDWDVCNDRGGNDGIWNGISGSTESLETAGWTFDGSKAYEGYQCGRFGSASAKGSAETPSILYDGEKDLVLTFNAGAWNASDEKTSINIVVTNAISSLSEVTLTKGEWSKYEIKLTNVISGFKIKWESQYASKNRFFLDNICISEEGSSIELDIITWYNDSIIISKNYFDSIPFEASNIRIDGLLTKTSLTENNNGEFKVPVDVSGSYCENKKFVVSDGRLALAQTIRIPQIVTSKTNTSDISDSECDVVVHDTLVVDGISSANRDVKLYGGAHLSVPSGTEYTINSLSMRRDNLETSTLGLTGTLNTDHLDFDLYIDYTDWYFVCLPDAFNLSNLKYVNGRAPVFRSDYWVRWYDGKNRAQTQSGSWKNAPADTTFQKGAGFIFGLNDDLKKKEFRFELSADALSSEKSNKTLGDLHAWGGDQPELRPNHKGWNMIGNPFLNSVVTDLASPIREDSLVKVLDGNGNWTGQWELSNTTRGKSLRYAVIPSDDPEDADAGHYKSVVLDDITLQPFTCFFVQIGGTDPSANQTITFNTADRGPYMAPKRYVEEDEELFLRIKVDNWKTGMFISKNFSDKYEPGDDLESRYPIYQNIGGYKLLYSAINDSIIENGVSVNTPEGHLILDPKVNKSAFEYIYVYYNNTWYNLLYEELNVKDSFIIYAKRKQVATDLEVIPTEGIYKFTDGKNVYINRNNKIYSIIGS